MSKWFLILPGLLAAAPAFGQAASPDVELANLREDVRGLSQRVSDLSLRLEQVETENARLAAQMKTAGQDGVSAAELRDAVAASKDETLRIVAVQMEKLARETNAALASLARAPDAHAAEASGFAADFPKEGITYTIQKGDSIALIAKKTGGKISDIINANKIADPSRIMAGQTLFIPGGK